MGFFGKLGGAIGGGLKALTPGLGGGANPIKNVKNAGKALGGAPGMPALGGAIGRAPGGNALAGALGLPGKAAPTATSSMSIAGPAAPSLAVGAAPSLAASGGPSLAAAPDLAAGDGGMAAGPEMAAGPSLSKKAFGKGRAMRGGRR